MTKKQSRKMRPTHSGDAKIEPKPCRCGCKEKFVPTRSWQVFKKGHSRRFWNSKQPMKYIAQILDRLEAAEAKVRRLERRVLRMERRLGLRKTRKKGRAA